MLRKVTHCAGRVSANTRPHQLRWGDREMGTAIYMSADGAMYSTSQIKVYIPFSNYDRSTMRIIPFHDRFVIVSHPYQIETVGHFVPKLFLFCFVFFT